MGGSRRLDGETIPVTMVKMTMMRALVTLLFALTAARVDSFASWLQCYVDLDESEVIMNHEVKSPDDENPVLVEFRAAAAAATTTDNEKEWKEAIAYPADTPTTLYARLKAPTSLVERLGDLEYVVETTEGGKFEEPGAVCDGVRAHAKSQNEQVTLRIDGAQEKVEVWGGYASGHEAVTLTKKAVLWREGSHPPEEEEL